MSSRFRAALYLASALFSCASLRADFITIAQPDPAYVSGTTLVDFTEDDFSLVGSLSAGGQTLSYDNWLDVRTVPNGGWGMWGAPPATETATPRVGTTDGFSELTITLSRPASIFGFELEPNFFLAEETTADFYSGSTLVGTIDLFPDGNGGALLFAASTTTDPFTSIVINNLDGDDFAIARQRFALASVATPEPATYGLLGISLAALLVLRRRRAA